MRIGLTYNIRKEETEQQAELLTEEDVERLLEALRDAGYNPVPIEVTGTPDEIIDRLVKTRPELILNVAEGVNGAHREAYYPAIFQMMRLPFTGSSSFVLRVGLDKNLTEAILARQGIRVPYSRLINERNRDLPKDVPYPAIIKPNAEGSSKGISSDSIVENREDAEELISGLLPEYPMGLIVEQYIQGREIAVPWLEAWPGGILEVVEWTFQTGDEYRVMTYESEKQGALEAVCPPELSVEERQDILAMSDRVVRALELSDWGRVDIRLHENGAPYLIEANALPGLAPTFSYMAAAKCKGLELSDVLDLVIKSAARRYEIPVAEKVFYESPTRPERVSASSLGIEIGRFPTGDHNAITDVAGVKVGHVTHVEDGEDNENGKRTVRSGVTAVLPSGHELFNNHLVCGGFILNGIGEMSGLTQAIEWGWLETPIVLTNTMSIGAVHRGVIKYMLSMHPELGRELSVVIPIIGETDDSFLNDVRIDSNRAEDVLDALSNASSGTVEQGSVGGGTGMISFDFAGGVGSASRVLPRKCGGYTLGVLVQSNFGRMRNLTVEGKVVGKELDPLYPYDTRRQDDRGSVIVVLATDAPLLSTQLNKLSKRAALGLGRVGSHASSTSGEIIFAFSTANLTTRMAKECTRQLNMSFISDDFISPLYEAAVEATEEAVLNAIFYSSGMDGRFGRTAPPVPTELILEMLGLENDNT